jgi:2-methylcitrate dehydratase PrpD
MTKATHCGNAGRMGLEAALLDGHIGMETFTDAQVHRPAIAALLAKTHLDMDPHERPPFLHSRESQRTGLHTHDRTVLPRVGA